MQPADTLTIPLDPPIKFDDEVFDKLVLQEPTGGQLQKTDGLKGHSANIALIAAVAGVPPGVVRKLGARQFTQAKAFFRPFYAVGKPLDEDARYAPHVIPLDPPVKLGELEYRELKLREPTAGELAETDDLGDYATDIRIVAIVAGLPDSAVRLVRARPLLAATRYLAGFL